MPLKLAFEASLKRGDNEPHKIEFSVRRLEALNPAKKQAWVYDAKTPGLAMLTLPSGRKTFYFAKRMDGRYRRVKIGAFPSVTVEQARKAVARFNGQIVVGENPANDRIVARSAMTLGELWNIYLERHAKPRNRTWRGDQYKYEKHLAHWSSRRLNQITKQDVARWHANIGKDAPIAANRARSLLRKLFNYAVTLGAEVPNPATSIRPFNEQSRSRFLDSDELPRFFEAVNATDYTILRDFLKVCLFTAQRRGNVSAMRWQDVDLARKVWTIPADQFKTGQTVEVPLADAVMPILKARKAENDAREEPSAFVFPSKRIDPKTPHFVEPGKGFKRICERAGIVGLRVHDLRRTAAAWATRIGTPYPVVAAMLGHAADGVTSVYTRVDPITVREAFDRTCAAMLATLGNQEADDAQEK